MFAEINAMRIGAFHNSLPGKKDGENMKPVDTTLDLAAISTKMKSICAEFLPRLVHAVNMVGVSASQSIQEFGHL